ncbi:histone H3.v1-like [Oncorhynchus nerka]|uniref:histone H3.v1-like n=1 Tax=Oncorhynchus nerka TaxID=8023 RepID=UPI0031B81C8E
MISFVLNTFSTHEYIVLFALNCSSGSADSPSWDLRAEEGEGHNDDDEEEEEEEEEENNKAEEKEKSEDMEGQSLQGQSQSTAEPSRDQRGGWIIMKCLLCIVAEDSGQPSPLALTEESSASSTQLQNRTTEEKPKNQPRTNRKLLLFKRLSSKAKQTEDSAEAPVEGGTGMGELPASAKGPSAGLENRDPSGTSASGAQPPLRAPSDSGGRGARSTTCTLL